MTPELARLLAQIPAPVRDTVFADELPRQDVRSMRVLAEGWSVAEQEFLEHKRQVDTVIAAMPPTLGGETGDAAVEAAVTLSATLQAHAEFCDDMAGQCEESAAEAEKSLYEMILFGAMLAHHVQAAVAAGAAPAAAMLLAGGRQTFRRMRASHVATMSADGALAAARRLGFAAAFPIAVGGGARLAQVTVGNRHLAGRNGVDLRSLADVAGLGVAVVGDVSGGAVANELPRLPQLLGGATGNVTKTVAGVVGGVVAATSVDGSTIGVPGPLPSLRASAVHAGHERRAGAQLPGTSLRHRVSAPDLGGVRSPAVPPAGPSAPVSPEGPRVAVSATGRSPAVRSADPDPATPSVGPRAAASPAEPSIAVPHHNSRRWLDRVESSSTARHTDMNSAAEHVDVPALRRPTGPRTVGPGRNSRSVDVPTRSAQLRVRDGETGSLDLQARNRLAARTWDWLGAQMTDWPAGKIDDAGLTAADVVEHMLGDADGAVSVAFAESGVRGDRVMTVRILDTGTTLPPESVLADDTHGRLAARLPIDDPAGWGREISFRFHEAEQLPDWLGAAFESLPHVPLQVPGEIAVAVRYDDIPQVAAVLAPLVRPIGPVEAVEDAIDDQLRHQATRNRGRVRDGSTAQGVPLEVHSGDTTVEVNVYPFRNQPFHDGVRALELTGRGGRHVPLDEFTGAMMDRPVETGTPRAKTPVAAVAPSAEEIVRRLCADRAPQSRTRLSDGGTVDYLAAAADSAVDMSKLVDFWLRHEGGTPAAGWRTDDRLLLRGDTRDARTVHTDGFHPSRRWTAGMVRDTVCATADEACAKAYGRVAVGSLPWRGGSATNVFRVYVIDAPGGFDPGPAAYPEIQFPGGVHRTRIVGGLEIPTSVWPDGASLTDIANIADYWRPNPHYRPRPERAGKPFP